ncbi:hypothetical protein [Nocardioides plantarum]|uniref:Mce-associated membrane protein n=1 Tax=Nocardioides plantarum TaxID=29299 RepID=A0ABV5KD10_9ACTN|nr:hypothetical protein [Nocardioides plantarum]
MGVLRDRRVAVLLVLVLAGSALCVLLALTRSQAEGAGVPPGSTGDRAPGFRTADLRGPGGDALAAAVTGVSTSLSYDYRYLDGSLTRATALMTPAYSRVFARTFDRRVRPFARQRRAVAQGLVRGAGIVRTRGDTRVVCLLYVDQLLVAGRGVRAGEPRVLSRSRARVDVVLSGGVWRIRGIEAL